MSSFTPDLAKLKYLHTAGADKRVMADQIGKLIADRIIADDAFSTYDTGEQFVFMAVQFADKEAI